MPPAKVNWPQPGKRHPGNPITGAGEQAVTKADLRAAITQALSTSDLATMLALGAINQEPVAGTIGIQHISRPFLWKYVANAAANYSITATTPTVIDSANLGGTIMSTGRPLFIAFGTRVLVRGTTLIAMGVRMDGVELGSTSSLYVRASADIDTAYGFWVATDVKPGARRLDLTAFVDAGTGTVSANSGNYTFLLAVEL